MANTGFIQTSTDLDYLLIAIDNKSVVPDRYRKYNNPVFGYAGKLFGWGYAGSGALGLNNTTNRSSPTQVGSDINWKLVSAGYYMANGIKADGTLWTWGSNTLGQLGLNTSTTFSSPVQVGTNTNWASLTNRPYYRSLAIKTDGTLWAWGYNNYGQLGLNNTTIYSSPVQVGTNTNWQSLYSDQYCNHAITTSGTLFAWGFNGSRLGLNDTTNRSFPTQVGTNTNWKQLGKGREGHNIAVKTDGTLWAWGAGSFGVLGLGDSTTYSSPVQVGTNTNWSSVATGYYHSLAIKTDGTLWSWGRNNVGQLGHNNTTNYSSPVQVGTNTNWSKIFECADHSVAIKTDGTLWTWGLNNIGQLGLDYTANRSSPVQVGTNTNWLTAAVGDPNTFGHTHAIAQ